MSHLPLSRIFWLKERLDAGRMTIQNGRRFTITDIRELKDFQAVMQELIERRQANPPPKPTTPARKRTSRKKEPTE